MRATITIDDKFYETKETDEFTAEQAAERLFEALGDADKFMFNLSDGGIMTIGEDVAKRAIIIFYD